MDGSHRFIGHQGKDHTMSLLKEWFWWPGMIREAAMMLKNCRYCIKFEGAH